MIPANEQQRIDFIDILRGIAVFGMICAHSLFFFHDGTLPFLNSFQQLLNVTMFPLFVFVSGLTVSHWLDSHNERSPLGRKKILTRALQLYIGYLALACIAVSTTQPFTSFEQFLLQIFGIASFTYFPNFTEYFPFFIILTLSTLIAGWFYKLSRKLLLYTLIAGLALYLIGLALYPIELPFPFDQWKSLFAGGMGLLRFPLFFYMLSFLTGVWWFKHKSLSVKIGFLFLSSLILSIFFIFKDFPAITFFHPFTRWPPSLGNVLLGIVSAGSLTIIITALLSRFPTKLFLVFTLLGKFALEVWMIHMIILFIYDAIFSYHSGNILFLLLGFSFITLLSILFIEIKTQIKRAPKQKESASPHEPHKQIPLKYIGMSLGILSILVLSVLLPNSSSLYGNSLELPNIVTIEAFPEQSELRLTTSNTWVLKDIDSYKSLTARATLFDQNKEINLSPDQVTFYVNENPVETGIKTTDQGSVVISIPAESLPIGEHSLTVSATSGSSTKTSNNVTIKSSYPLLLAWTMDWEGWNAPDTTLQELTAFSTTYHMPITHFVSPRTFTSTAVTEERRNLLKEYLKDREKKGDEIAMHLHMHNDFVEQAGITPRSEKAWGLFSQEGYDIPTTQYTPEEFRKLISYGKYIFLEHGFSSISGYRAGGWFLSTDLFNVLEQEGFTYDSSARERPIQGAFNTIPWNITFPAQPYFPDRKNQNTVSSVKRSLLEIPNNGANTYEFSSNEIIEKLHRYYQGKPLEKPLTFVIVSHPQFSYREFSKISELLPLISSYSITTDNGPIVFSTMSDINSLWRTYLH